WAVIIGIDAYDFSPLRGSVADALLMTEFLTKNLGVPKHRTQCLFGFSRHKSCRDSLIPSRVNIVNTLLSLTTNSEIACGDNIVIYFSGHGSTYYCDEYYDSDPSGGDEQQVFVAGAGSIEALCPMDRNTLDVNGAPIPDISDREINTILTQISRVKGHRITFILDCCHSSSVTR
ncbi:hypothetical protein EDD85DRAFT_750788, partial [Armillaria nabsnona]